MKIKQVILTGDIHGEIARLLKYNKYLNKNDLLIILGDFGIIWENDTDFVNKKLKFLDENINYQIAFLDGNHENFPQIANIEQIENWYQGKIGRISKQIIHLLRGEIYYINGKRIGVMGGAESIDKAWRKENVSWWAQEEITKKDLEHFKNNLNENNKIDIMLSHDCPASVVPEVCFYSKVNQITRFSNSQRILEEVRALINYNLWYFGHWHIDQALNDNFECLFQNLKQII